MWTHHHYQGVFVVMPAVEYPSLWSVKCLYSMKMNQSYLDKQKRDKMGQCATKWAIHSLPIEVLLFIFCVFRFVWSFIKKVENKNKKPSRTIKKTTVSKVYLKSFHQPNLSKKNK